MGWRRAGFQNNKGQAWGSPLVIASVLFGFAGALFPVALTRQGFLSALLFTWFQVEGMPLDFLNDVLLLDFAFETPQSAFQGLSVLDMDFCQTRLTCLLLLPAWARGVHAVS